MRTHARGWSWGCHTRIHGSKQSTNSFPYFSLTEILGKTIPRPVCHNSLPSSLQSPTPPRFPALLSLSLSLYSVATFSLYLYIAYSVLSKKIMAACDSLRSLFENPLPEKPTLMESLSWNQTKPKKPVEPCFTEIFGELHFQEKPQSESDQSPRFNFLDFDKKKGRNGEIPSLDFLPSAPKDRYRGGDPKSNGGFSPKNSESLQHCTEGLGSESSDDVEELINEPGGDGWNSDHEKVEKGAIGYMRSYSDVRPRSGGRGFPPPISSIGRSGKPWVCFKSYREGGRFVLREIRIPTHEILHASREDGRLKLHFVHPGTDMAKREEEEQDKEEEQDQEIQVSKGQ